MSRHRGSVLRNRNGEVISFDEPDGTPVSGNGVPIMGFRRLSLNRALNSGAFYDTNSRLSATPSDGGEGSGISVSLTGGLAALTDPLDGAYAVWNLESLFGAPLADTGLVWSVMIYAVERGSPSTGTNHNWAVGLMNEATDSGTIDGVLQGITYGANRNYKTASTANGTATVNNAVVSTARAVQYMCGKIGEGSTSGMMANQLCSLDSSRAYIGTSSGGLTPPASFGEAAPYLYMAHWRSATTAGTSTVAVDFYVGLGLSARLPV